MSQVDTVDHLVLLINAAEVGAILKNQEETMMRIVAQSYVAHAEGKTSLPQSSFLRFPGNQSDRVIALPAYLADAAEEPAFGIKWISSFPFNLKCGLPRASALIILNSTQTGRPICVLEGSQISACRTVASAALCCRLFEGQEHLNALGLVGCGNINSTFLRFVAGSIRRPDDVFVFDTNPHQAKKFKSQHDDFEVVVADSLDSVLRNSKIVCFATTAQEPYLKDTPSWSSLKLVLHLSLRDIIPELILQSDNIVDDIDHVCRAATSLHLSEQLCGNRNFIRGTIADVLSQHSNPPRQLGPTVVSPFGLGILDIAVARFVYQQAVAKNHGVRIDLLGGI